MVPKLQRRWFCIYDSDDEIGELLVMATMTAVMTMDDDDGNGEPLKSFVGGRPKVNRWKNHKAIPDITPEAVAMSKELKRRGFGFVGPTVCYALMQSTGMVNDHPVSTWQWRRVNDIVTRRFGKSKVTTAVITTTTIIILLFLFIIIFITIFIILFIIVIFIFIFIFIIIIIIIIIIITMITIIVANTIFVIIGACIIQRAAHEPASSLMAPLLARRQLGVLLVTGLCLGGEITGGAAGLEYKGLRVAGD
ncbi:DNA-3-methyladenine glycosylase 1 [Symbiodinium microadriaticum]|uniref:DNA-3-methyladenine glycosylase 1 n=1 Tax=Symbiodinium microadriaticum TaxID=2951 RepID=A0A1Q9D6J9_SYMMI|nr:DNA-3-methyladenine glycosylase 1 [Symbiodinium microadriaticum]